MFLYYFPIEHDRELQQFLPLAAAGYGKPFQPPHEDRRLQERVQGFGPEDPQQPPPGDALLDRQAAAGSLVPLSTGHGITGGEGLDELQAVADGRDG